MAPIECPFCEVEHKVAVPQIHSNGTAPQDLLESVQAVLSANRKTLTALGQAFPNGRDYYLVPGAYEVVRVQWDARVQALQRMEVDLVEIRDHIQTVIDFQEERR